MKRFDDINVIPFIDIMLVLLAIVLTTASFIAQGKLDVTLPEAESGQEAAQEPPVEVAIDAEEKLFFNGERVDLAALKAALDEVETDTSVTLRVDKGVPFGRFVTVVDALKARDLEDVAILKRDGGG